MALTANLFVVVLATLLLPLAAIMVFLHAPADANQGFLQKIFYFHVPSAFAAYLGYVICGIASLAYLLKESTLADRIALAGAECGSLFSLCVLITGPIWAHKAWGRAWEWDPRLTTMLLTFLLYAAYLLLRRSEEDSTHLRRIAAVLGTLGLLGVALVRVAVRLWGGIHPQVITGQGRGIHPDMVPAFALSMLAFLALALSLVALRTRLAMREAHLAQLRLEIEAIQEDVRV